MPDPSPLANPITACENAINHFTRLRDDLLADADRYRRKGLDKRAEADAAQADMNRWIQAKATLSGEAVTGPDPNPLIQARDAIAAAHDALLPAGLPQQAYEEYQRAYREYSADHPDHPFLRWAMLDGASKKAWRSVTGFLMNVLAQHNKPAVELSDSSDLAHSAYQAWQQQFGYPTRTPGDLDWDKQGSVFKRRWTVVVETVKELLKNEGWGYRGEGWVNLSTANAEYINRILADRGWTLALSFTRPREQQGTIITKADL